MEVRQCVAFMEVLAGRNAFITGAAGCGKSYVIKLLRTALQDLGRGSVHMVAPTGVAALSIGGTTIAWVSMSTTLHMQTRRARTKNTHIPTSRMQRPRYTHILHRTWSEPDTTQAPTYS